MFQKNNQDINHYHIKDEQKSVSEHLFEIRSRIIAISITIFIGAGIGHYYHKEIISFILKPIEGQELIFLSPLDPLIFIFKIDFFAGLLLAFPVINWCIFTYIRPAFSKINKVIYITYMSSLLLFILGILYAFFVIVPINIQFLSSINVSEIRNVITAQNYFSFFITQLSIIAFIFQIPLFILMGSYANIFSSKNLRTKRVYIYLFAVIVLSILTPTSDLFNLFIILVPALAIFEISIIGVVILEFFKRRKMNLKSEKID